MLYNRFFVLSIVSAACLQASASEVVPLMALGGNLHTIATQVPPAASDSRRQKFEQMVSLIPKAKEEINALYASPEWSPYMEGGILQTNKIPKESFLEENFAYDSIWDADLRTYEQLKKLLDYFAINYKDINNAKKFIDQSFKDYPQEDRNKLKSYLDDLDQLENNFENIDDRFTAGF